MSYFHLFTHAFFKRVLFIRVGVIIHFFFNNQDIRNYNFLFLNILKARIILSVFSLIGLFFSSGFLRKDFILEKIFLKKRSFIILWLFFIIMFLTIFYSIRLLISVSFVNINNKIFYYSFRTKIILSLILLAFLRLVIGNFLNWNFLYFVWIFCFIKYKFFILLISINSFYIFYFLKKINLLKNFFIIRSIIFLVKITFFFNIWNLYFKKIVSQILEKRILEVYENNNFFKIINLNFLFNRKNFLIYLILTIIIRFFFIIL